MSKNLRFILATASFFLWLALLYLLWRYWRDGELFQQTIKETLFNAYLGFAFVGSLFLRAAARRWSDRHAESIRRGWIFIFKVMLAVGVAWGLVYMAYQVGRAPGYCCSHEDDGNSKEARSRRTHEGYLDNLRR